LWREDNERSDTSNTLKMTDLMLEAETIETEKESASERGNGVDFFDLLFVLTDARKRIAIFVLVAMVIGATIAMIAAPVFTASALILPPQQSQSTLTSLMGQIGSLASLAGAGSQLKTPADMYLGVLESRTIADHLIDKFHLQDLYKTKSMEDTRIVLKKHSKFIATKDGLIHISVEDHSASRASDMTNAYVDELYVMNSHLAITEAAQRRVFFDQELANEKNALATAEEALKQMEEKTGVIQLPGQAEIIIRSLAQVRAEIASREVQIQAMRTFATDQNPQAIRLQEEINSLRDQLAKLENDPRASQLDLNGMPAGRVPAVGLEYARRLRDVRFNEALFELLTKQYEAARIDEGKAAPLIQVVDRAVPPDKKSSPHRALITLGFGFIGFLIASIVSVTSRMLERMERVPEYSAKVTRLRSWFRFRRSR
jgi:tyrosine-protein kinase Etk/Wzc